MNRLCGDVGMSNAYFARLIALAIVPLGCGGELSPYDGWIWESTECSNQCSIASSSSLLETLSFAGDRATFAEHAGGCSLTVTDVPVEQTSEGMTIDLTKGRAQCDPDPCKATYPVSLRSDPSCAGPFATLPRTLATLTCPPDPTFQLEAGVVTEMSSERLTLRTTLGGICFISFRHSN